MGSSWFRSWWSRAAGKQRNRAARRRPASLPLRLEALETRLVPSGLPQLLGDINHTLLHAAGPRDLTAIGSTLFFSENDGVHGYQLWESNGTPLGTTMVTDINPGATGFDPEILTNVNGTLFFAGTDGVHGDQLWESNGTPFGTTMITDINPSEGFSPSSITNVNGTLFFDANDGVHGDELWASNGFSAGTYMVADINPGSTVRSHSPW